MTFFTRYSTVLFGMLLAGAASAAPPPAKPMTLEEAVAKVQRDTGGRILSADPRQFGRRTEYRIKVLTPEGHVRVISITADAERAPAGKSGKRPPDNGVHKERH